MSTIDEISLLMEDYEDQMKKTIEALEADLRTVRAGRANPHVLDPVTVSYYGVPTPIKQIANVQIPEAKLLVITPWDTSMLKEIERALQASDIGINPVNDGRCIRLVFPALTEERRRELTRDVSKKGESAKVTIRHIRRDANDKFKSMGKDKLIPEDLSFKLCDDVQELTDQYIANVDTTVENKNRELMEI
jgi:ribosome recycling factor